MKSDIALQSPQDMLSKLKREGTRLNKAIETQSGGEMVDSLFNFCVTAYHISDWLINSPGLPLTRKEVCDFIEGTPVLSACRDICCHLKHFRVSSPSTKKLDVSLTSITREISPSGQMKLTGTVDFDIIMNDGVRFRSGFLANTVISSWEDFFRDHNV